MKKNNITFIIFLILIIALLMNVHLFAQNNTYVASYTGTTVKEVPAEFKVYQNFPNPCFNSTTIKFDIASQSDAKLVIYDANGNVVKSYLYNNIKPGSYQLEIDATYFNKGEYSYTFTTAEYTQSYTMTVLK